MSAAKYAWGGFLRTTATVRTCTTYPRATRRGDYCRTLTTLQQSITASIPASLDSTNTVAVLSCGPRGSFRKKVLTLSLMWQSRLGIVRDFSEYPAKSIGR